MNKEIRYSWEEFDKDILLIIKQIYDSRWMPQFIVGIKRGGLVPAVALSHKMHLPLIVISCQLRDGKEEFNPLEIVDLPKNAKLLVVDDICDSGKTLEKVFYSLKKDFSDIKSCSLFHNIRQKFYSDYKARKIDRDYERGWIIFPWEV
jgi:hypoxanthine phosphoribosyltransferase